MAYLTMGSYTIPFTWISFFIAFIFLEFKNRKNNSETKSLFENTIWIYILSWKLSYIPFNWSTVIATPLSILYFDGGIKGHFISLIVVMIYFFKNSSKIEMSFWKNNLLIFVTIALLISLIGQGNYIGASTFGILFILIAKKWDISFLFILLTIIFTNWWNPYLWLVVVLFIYEIIREKQWKQFGLLVLVPFITIISSNMVSIQNKALEGEAMHIELKEFSGETFLLEEQEDSITVVNFFATWCPPCKAEMPHLQSFSEDEPPNVQLIGIQLTARDNGEQALKELIQRYDITYPILLDEEDRYGELFHIQSMPTTIILKNGIEVNRVVGPITEETLNRLLLKLDETS